MKIATRKNEKDKFKFKRLLVLGFHCVTVTSDEGGGMGACLRSSPSLRKGLVIFSLRLFNNRVIYLFVSKKNVLYAMIQM